MSLMFLTGLGLVMFSVGGLLITTSRFTKYRDVSGVIIYKDKKTGQEYACLERGYLKEIYSNDNKVSRESEDYGI